MSEQQLSPEEHQVPAAPQHPTPYNLDDFPAYREELLRRAQTDAERADIEATFDPEAPEWLAVMSSPEQAAAAHQVEFRTLYPAFDQVMEYHEEHIAAVEVAHGEALAENQSRERRHNALEAIRTAEQDPGSYRNYWQVEAEQSEVAGNARLAGVMRQNAGWQEKSQRQLFRPAANLHEATDWYRNLGSFNRGRGAERVMVFAAHLPFRTEEYVEGRLNTTEPEQRLIAGSMLSEASLLNGRHGENSPEQQAVYEADAREMFRRVIGAKRQPELSEAGQAQLARQAEVYDIDLDFRAAHRLAGQAQREQDAQLREAAYVQARAAVSRAEQLVSLLKKAQSTTEGKDHQDVIGESVERAIWLLLLRQTVSSGRLAEELPYQAFTRQDAPRDNMVKERLPNRGFDVVLATNIEVPVREESGDGTRSIQVEIPIQAKNSLGREVYDRRIVKITNLGDNAAAVIDLAARRVEAGQTAGAVAAERVLGPRLDEVAHRTRRNVEKRWTQQISGGKKSEGRQSA